MKEYHQLGNLIHSNIASKTPLFSVREITLLKELKHPNIVELMAICLESEKIYLVFEYMNMDLKQYLDSTKRE